MTMPDPAYPFLWDSRLGWADNFEALQDYAETANRELNEVYGTDARTGIDEIAMLAPSREMVLEFIDEAVTHGWTYFNRESDTVRTEPMGTVYTVEYYFLRSPVHPWRFEIMRKVGGISPVHDALTPFTGNGMPLVHASFKPLSGENEEGYAYAQRVLNDAGWWMAQECRSTYGQFGYWRAVNDRMLRYLKPRINTRDAVTGRVRLPQQVVAEAGLAPEQGQTWQTEGEAAS